MRQEAQLTASCDKDAKKQAFLLLKHVRCRALAPLTGDCKI
jgi:hypothetical protein